VTELASLTRRDVWVQYSVFVGKLSDGLVETEVSHLQVAPNIRKIDAIGGPSFGLCFDLRISDTRPGVLQIVLDPRVCADGGCPEIRHDRFDALNQSLRLFDVAQLQHRLYVELAPRSILPVVETFNAVIESNNISVSSHYRRDNVNYVLSDISPLVERRVRHDCQGASNAGERSHERADDTGSSIRKGKSKRKHHRRSDGYAGGKHENSLGRSERSEQSEGVLSHA
jgi:hypothetical protein